MEVVPTHARVSPHPAHATRSTSEEGLENAVGVNVVEAATAATVLHILSTIVHAALLLVAQYCISLTHLVAECE